MEASELMSACGGLKEELNEDGETIFMPVDINAFEQKVENLVVLARATPKDKLLLTAGLKALGRLTAVIGDGNNDI
jgi:magnesium-transporting ATPase (P-type)